MPHTVGVKDIAGYHLVVANLIYLKRLALTKMLEDLTIFVCHCNFHSVYLIEFMILYC